MPNALLQLFHLLLQLMPKYFLGSHEADVCISQIATFKC